MNARRDRFGAGTAALGVALALGLAGAPPAGVRAVEESGPVQRIEQLHDALLEVMRNADELGFQGRAETLRPVIQRSYDIPFMAEKTLGRYWSELGPEQRRRMVDAFQRMTVVTYAVRFDGYDGEAFEILENRPSVQGTVLVRSRILRGGDGDPVELTYRLRKLDASWRVIDVYLRGTVSELAMRRSEYTSVVRREGFESLIAALDEKIRELSSGEARADPVLDSRAGAP